MIHFGAGAKKRLKGVLPEYSRFLFGLALLLAVLSDDHSGGAFYGVSTVITSKNDPSALEQLATFASMEDVAEEQELDWGSTRRLSRLEEADDRPRDAIVPDIAEVPIRKKRSPTPHSAASSSVGEPTPSSQGESEGASQSLDSSTSMISRCRPHRRRHRRSGAAHRAASDATSRLSSAAISPAASGVEQPPPHFSVWTQLHVWEVACSTSSNNFVHVTERWMQYRKMYPIVYRCDLSRVDCPSEQALLASPRVGLAASSRWTCEQCHRQHGVVRERCERCQSPGPYAKLFFGQAVKEISCAESLIRFLYATHPEIQLHRVESHCDSRASGGIGGLWRGKGCASVYVLRDAAETLRQKLNRNAYFDMDLHTGGLVAYYVYGEQQGWLEAFVNAKHSSGAARPSILPLAPLVVEESSTPLPRFNGRQPYPMLHTADRPVGSPYLAAV